MRNYGKRFLQNKMLASVAAHTETRDAILWDVLPDQRLCRLKVQGSSTLIVAHYPENWEQTPAWLKPGNAVKVMHTGGLRGRIELVGHGQVVPTPVSGGDPAIPTAPDAVVTGCMLTGSGMNISVSAGTYRIGGALYALTPPAPIGLAAPVAPNFRYDIFVVAADGTVDHVAGTPALPPVMPATPASHVLLGWALCYPAQSAISPNDIGKLYRSATITGMSATASVNPMDWATATSVITVTVRDQYNQPYAGTWTITATIDRGNGTLDSMSKSTGGAGSITFTHTRGQVAGDASPHITFSCNAGGRALQASCFITLLDVSGNPMY